LAEAAAVEARAANWLQRREFFDWSAEDQAELDAWLEQSAANLVTYLRLEAAWTRASRLTALRSPMRAATEPPPRKNLLPIALKSVAALAVVAVVGVTGANYLLRPQEAIYATPVGGHRTIALADGSRIDLNTDTVLAVRGRAARLEKGEAYFQIRHDPGHPFVVVAGDHRIADLGTKFLVRSQPGRLEVSLVEGKALVETTETAAQPQAALLTPGDVAIATTDALTLRRKPEAELANKLGWRQGLLIFKHTTLVDAAAEFNRYNDQKLIVADQSTGALKIYGTFRANNAAQFAAAAQTLLGLRLKRTGRDIVMSR
jgi:transmembrane sensor